MFEPHAHSITKEERHYCYTLWMKHDWLNRRVDSIEPIDNDLVRRYTSFDINFHTLREKFSHVRPVCKNDESGNSFPYSDHRCPVPLFLRNPEPILDIDIIAGGKSQSLAGRSISTRFATAIVLEQISRSLSEHKTDYQNYYDKLSNDIYYWIYSGDSSRIEMKLNECIDQEDKIERADVELDELLDNKATKEILEYGWLLVDILLDTGTSLLLADFSTKHLVVTFLDQLPNHQNYILKVVIDVPDQHSKHNLLFGIRGFSFGVNNIPLDRYNRPRHHHKIKIPIGLSVTNMRLHAPDSNEWLELADDCRIVATKQAIEIHKLHAKEDWHREAVLQIELKPTFTAFADKALSLCATLIIFFIIAQATQINNNEVIVLSIAVSAFAVTMPVLFRTQDESSLLSSLLTESRITLGVVTFISIILVILHKLEFFCMLFGWGDKAISIALFIFLVAYFTTMLVFSGLFYISRNRFQSRIYNRSQK